MPNCALIMLGSGVNATSFRGDDMSVSAEVNRFESHGVGAQQLGASLQITYLMNMFGGYNI